MPRNEEYYKHYSSVYTLISRSYWDVYSLEAIKNYSESAINNGLDITQQMALLQHFCVLLKADLGLNLWKIYVDTDNRSANIFKLKNYLPSGSFDKKRLRLSPLSINKQRSLSAIRKEYLAHNDMHKSYSRIGIDTLSKILEELCDLLNYLCRPDVDDRVQPFTNSEKIKISLTVLQSINSLLSQQLPPSVIQTKKCGFFSSAFKRLCNLFGW